MGLLEGRTAVITGAAQGLGYAIAEAFVAAGYITEEEAKVRPAARPSLDDLSDMDLLDEVRKRMEARHAQASEDQAGSHPDVRAVRPGAPMSLDEARRVKDDPAAFGDQARRGEMDRRQQEADEKPLEELLDLAADKGERMDDD